MSLRLAAVVSHPIQHFAPWFREIGKIPDIDLHTYYCCDWGIEGYDDPEFGVNVKWDIPLLDGYSYEFLPLTRRPERLSYWQVNNKDVAKRFDTFQPDIVMVFGYAHRTNWKVADWANRHKKPLLLYSDSNIRYQPHLWKKLAKQIVVGNFYNRVDGALYVGDNNRAYHKMYGLSDERLFPGALPIDRDQLLGQVSNRVDVRRSTRDKLGIPLEAFVVASIGKYSARKRPLDLAMAVHKAAQVGLPVWGLLVGEGRERVALEEFCRRERLANVVLTGFINQSQIPAYYVSSDILAVPSSYDPHPLVITEGSAFGLPSIVSDRIGCIGGQDTARPGENVIVFPCGDTNALYNAIESLYQNPNVYNEMSNASVEISETQDAGIVAQQLATAAHQLQALGPRHA